MLGFGNEHIPELLAPAGSFESLRAAIQGGADAVYLGVGELNMRRNAARNFSVSDIKEAHKTCLKSGAKFYFTLNSIIYDEDICVMKELCALLREIGVDALIAHDQAVLNYARSLEIPLHISTQANISNLEALKYYAQFADACVLARELTLEQITGICEQVKAQHICGPKGLLFGIEIFAHGALCVAIAGKCYMSLATQGLSANRGECIQPCRRGYRLIDEESGVELRIDNKYIMSPKDICTIGFLDRICASGISILKIEGRGRSPEYVYKVTKTYREALDSLAKGDYSPEKIASWQKELGAVYNRGFWQGGYYLGKQLGEWSATYGSRATVKKIYVGKISNYFAKAKVAELKVEAADLKDKDRILIIGPTTGVMEFSLTSLRRHDRNGVTIEVPGRVRENDSLYVLKERE